MKLRYYISRSGEVFGLRIFSNVTAEDFVAVREKIGALVWRLRKEVR